MPPVPGDDRPSSPSLAALPDPVRRKAIAVGAEAWLDELPTRLAQLAGRWGLVIGSPFPDATEGFVAPVDLEGGGRAVLKVVVPRAGGAAQREATVLRQAQGEGCARLLRHDEALGALLVERLGPSLRDLDLPLGRRLEVLADAATALWRPVPAGLALPSGAERAGEIAAGIVERWDRLGRPCSEAAVAHALACAERRVAAHDDERAVLVHGDVHQWNALQADDGFKLVDPDGVRAEPECDLGVLLREDPVELLQGDPFDRARVLAARTGLDATAIWEWGVLERVSTGLVCEEVGLQPFGRQMLHAADVIAATAR
ncbi:aminoglycoside phosphotransferase family protein [Aquihabitans sp. G128]|uniref:aminoglycoside phosphotransferase family protein n=1 Tax=Aquihabitans sp. G128 TaxID=2849779 RepID=UPI001C24CD28|nr:aminoglycoside phosphotransferase family protein [Aquihabitans sp. G128]QXC62350.1 aminoglycoside phosphotransferase family protein [Aquihabitans sp. G128]